MPLAPVASPEATQMVRAAFEELKQTITPQDSRDFHQTTLQDVRQAALNIEVQLASRQCLRNMRRLMPLFQGLEHYANVMGVVCNGTPFLPWVWAPITLILRIACEHVEAFEQIMKGYSRIASALKRFEILSEAFSRDAGFQKTMAVFYADILQFHKHAYKFVRRNGWKLLFLTSWGRFQRRFDNILEDMERHEALIDLEANARDIGEGRQLRQDIRLWREESLAKTRRLDEEHAAKQYKAIMSWLKADESDQLAIFESISAEGSKYPGTCGWALKTPKVTSWLQKRRETPMLWLQGSPGTGKSVMSVQLINYMKAAKMFVIHHFCTYSYPASTSRPTRILAKRLGKRHTLSLSDEKAALAEAIRQYASQRLQSLHRKFSQLDIGADELREIEYGVARKADGKSRCSAFHSVNTANLCPLGMFLYARLVLDYLSTNIFYSGEEVKTSIDHLPDKLSDFSGDPKVTQLAPQYILDICEPLVEERSDESLALIHVSVKDFVQSPSSNLAIREEEVLQQHTTAVLACLISGLDVFHKGYHEHSRVFRVIKGMHGLHVYATEYWTEYLLSEASRHGGISTDTCVSRLASELANKLEVWAPSNVPLGRPGPGHSDERLLLLRQHETLQDHVKRSLGSRTTKQLEHELQSENMCQIYTQSTRLSRHLSRRTGALQEAVSRIGLHLSSQILPTSNFGV
ncbi:hypothetical protein CHGG_03759 [Chaetomium globosum CBS 148.51]|uniref:NWD NACHT-NTPase N-terminal domain-containing protein n=1 Tax=Chaetomium globosum (strain ATCC 6205 / CBS 148.51 / DSM 1962 / NBRC 6347 / NRRL 1970) TaxID=306901 RepID=Q2H387_CHAGB|nr:uncharacterized protein CHGG_03759 [Chaetomium globosum CBS 148.51]EAQ87140.1 hypothetical protein CHGG_03759 [Chaetomium globosum CBS 148.51]